MLFHIILLLVLNLAVATPPACFINCINNLSHLCAKNQADIKCLCKIHEAVNQCAVKYCPTNHFYSSRDHFSGTCVEHGFEFTSAPFDDDEISSFHEPPVEGFHLEEEEEAESENERSENEMSEYEPDIPQDIHGSMRKSASEPEDVGEWSEGEDWLEGNDWPQENDLDLSELNQDVIKNYMSYFIKKSPPSHPRIASMNGKTSPDHKVIETKTPQKRPFIVHGPSSYVTESSKGVKDKGTSRKTRYHKYDVGFDREKQDQILRKRL